MINKIYNILKSIILSWIILFGVISSHPECKSVISDICHQEELSFSVKQVSIFPANILPLNSMNCCKEGTCCEEQQRKDKEEFLIAEQYPKLFKQIWGNENKSISPNKKTRKLSGDSYQNRTPKNNSIYIFTQTFLC
jgi:hypothetical protein